MSTGFKVIAIIKDESAIELISTDYRIMKTKGGQCCLVERAPKKFYETESEETQCKLSK